MVRWPPGHTKKPHQRRSTFILSDRRAPIRGSAQSAGVRLKMNFAAKDMNYSAR